VAGICEYGVIGESGHRCGLAMLESTVDADETVDANEDIEETLRAGDIIPVRKPSSYEGFTFTVRSCMVLLDEEPVNGNVLLRTKFLILLRLKAELLADVLVELNRTGGFKAAGGDAGELAQPGETAFEGSW